MADATPELQKLNWKQRLFLYARFLAMAWRADPGLFVFRGVVLVGSAGFTSLQIYFFARLISAISNQDTHTMWFLVVAAIVSYAGMSLFDGIKNSALENWFARSISFQAQAEVLERLSHIDPARLQDARIRRDMDFVRSELWRVNNLPYHSEQFLGSLIQMVSAFGLATLAPWWVVALVLVDACIQSLKSSFESRHDMWAATWNSLDGRRVEYTMHTFMTSEELRELRLLGASQMFVKRFRDAYLRIVARFRSIGMRGVRLTLLGLLFHLSAYAVVLWTFGIGAFGNVALLSLLYVSINLFQLFGRALNGVSSAWAKMGSDLGVLSRVDDLLHYPIESDRGVLIPKRPLVIEFRDVSFSYPNAEKPALSGVNLIISEDEHLAVVGENGAGKSTFLRLLSGLEQPTSGAILVNGKPLASYKPNEWRRAFHLMLQGAKLYQDFIEAQLHYGESPKAWQKFSLSTSKGLSVSGADEVVRELPKGLQTFLGDWAAPPDVEAQQVSGGQQQRLLIARTLIHGGRILGFDEPTSAMDALAETSFFERLHEARKGRGLIYISHRFSTVRRASRILVFSHGKLMEDGSHEELLSQNGRYAALYKEQAQWYQT